MAPQSDSYCIERSVSPLAFSITLLLLLVIQKLCFFYWFLFCHSLSLHGSMEERSSEGQSSEGERQSGDEQLAGDAEQRQAGPTGPGTHTIENELAEGQLGIQQLFRSSERFNITVFRYR